MESKKLIKQLKQIIEELSSKDNYEIKHTVYWFIDSRGEVIFREWTNSSDDIERLQIGNVYFSRAEAETVVLNRKIHRFLQEQTDFVPDWGDDNDKYWLNFCNGSIDIDSWSKICQPSQVYFAEYEEAIAARDAAIAKFGKQAVIGYLRGGLV